MQNDSGSTSRTTINTNFTNLNTDKIEADSSETLTNKTIDADGTGNSISNIENADIKAAAAIDASKIADGTVTSAEFQYLGDVTSLIQAQLDAKGVIDNIVEDTTPQLGGMLDVNGQSLGDGTLELLSFVETGSAVNEFTITNAATGGGPDLSATGGDSDIDITLTPKGTGIVKGDYKRFMVRLIAAGTDLAADTTVGGDYRIANRAITVKAVGAYVDTAAATGSNLLTVDIHDSGTTILSTKLTVDVTEKTTTTAATAAVISDSAIAADAIVTFDIDQVNETTVAKGLVVWIDYIYA